MAKCTECGAAVADDLKFCGFCGTKLNIVSEHLGTRILGNSEVIIGALERIAPGAAQQYAVLGTAGDGPLAGGLILGFDANPGSFRPSASFFWSDGEKLTKVAVEHMVGCFERGTFAFNPELIDTCGSCLTKYHRARRVEGLAATPASGRNPALFVDGEGRAWSMRNGSLSYPVLQRDSWEMQLSGWIREMTGSGCPQCWSSTLLSPAYCSYRIRKLEQEFSEAARRLERGARACDLEASKKYNHKSVRAKYAIEAPQLRALAAAFLSVRHRVKGSVDSDLKAFDAFASEALSTPLEPPPSLAAWSEYQRGFVLMGAWSTVLAVAKVRTDYPNTSIRLELSHALADDLERRSAVTPLIG